MSCPISWLIWSSSLRVSRITVVLSLALLSACGFRLQGVGSYPPLLARTHISASDEYTLFYRELTVALEQGGVALVPSRTDATAELRIEKDLTGQKVLTVSGRNVPEEYDVFYTISYSVWADGEPVLASRTLSVSQDYTYDETRLLGKRREEVFIREAIVKDLVRLVSQELSRLN